MHIILGATGHVGSAVALTLLRAGEPVTVVTRDPNKQDEWTRQGAAVAIADVREHDQLRSVLDRGERLFVLNPPAAPATDTAREEQKSIASILAALPGSGIRRIVAQSTYGAQPGDQVGDLGVLYELEQGLAKTRIATSVIRAAYYMSNWDTALATAQQEGKLYTFYPPAFKLPMVAPQDLGQVAARLLRESVAQTGLYYVEGPQSYSSADVAAAFTSALGKQVQAVHIPQEQWIPTLQTLGFSRKGAESMAAMTAITLKQEYELPFSPIRGKITLEQYIDRLVKKDAK